MNANAQNSPILEDTPQDNPRRSLLKTLSWRFIASLDTFVIAYIATGKAAVSGGIVGAEVFTKMALYYLHERGWSRVRWGRNKR
jgi:uncharacterized membrane protein